MAHGNWLSHKSRNRSTIISKKKEKRKGLTGDKMNSFNLNYRVTFSSNITIKLHTHIMMEETIVHRDGAG